MIILSLEDAIERRAPLISALESHDISYEIWHAIDGRNGLPTDYETMIDRDGAREYLKRDMGNAEFACALSHHFIYRAVLERDLDMAVILEDDAIVDEQFFRFLKMVQIPDCDLLLLDHMRAMVRRTNQFKLESGVAAYRCLSSPLLTTGYIITKSGARKLLDQSLPIASPADWPIDVTTMQTFVTVPRLVDHLDVHTGPSDIRQDRQRHAYRKRRTARRFLRLSYWRKTFHKRLGKWVS
ncbi:MAG: glycosyltransferase family 25 protein [Paracoccaceae bacterium]|nr:glycosyltransferase family 25 protein [Paracoccaceae bacterium]